jgi:DNA-binding PadR family transcriptional regulator
LKKESTNRVTGASDVVRFWKAMKAGQVRIAILKILREQDMHGYAIMEEIRNRTGGFFSPGAGTIYPILKDLLSHGHVEGRWTSAGRRKRRVYHITGKGSETLRAFEKLLTEASQTMRENLSKASRILELDQADISGPNSPPGLFGFGAGGFYPFGGKGFAEKTMNEKLKMLREAQRAIQMRVRILKQKERNLSKQIESIQKTIS